MKKPTTEKPLCFVVMPFVRAVPHNGKYKELGEDELDTIFSLYKAVLGRLGYTVRRADSKGDILADIVLDLDRAELVCVDLTGLNPNVMYELGIRHGFAKPTIILSQDLTELPFDLRSYHCIQYGWVTEKERREFGQSVRSTVAHIRNNPDTRFGPVHSHLGSKRLALHEEEKRVTLTRLRGLRREIDLLCSFLESGLATLSDDELAAALIQKGDIVELRQEAEPEAKAAIDRRLRQLQQRITTGLPASDFFLSAAYVPHAFNAHGDIDSFSAVLSSIRFLIHVDTAAAREMVFEALQVIRSDLNKLIAAVDADLIGQPLNLRSRKWRSSGAEMRSRAAGDIQGRLARKLINRS